MRYSQVVVTRIGAALALGLWLTSLACAATGAGRSAAAERSAPSHCSGVGDPAAASPLAGPGPARDRTCELHCASFVQALGASTPCAAAPALALPATAACHLARPERPLPPDLAAREPPRALRLRLRSLLL